MPRKPTAAEDKLNALLGLTTKAAEVKTRSTGRVVGVTEPEIQEFREAQGLVYFLQAPALFEARVCRNPKCGAPFLVSRKHVAYCSYSCINDSLAELGIKWSKAHDLELLAQDPQVYDGNEPLWIRNPTLNKALTILQELLQSTETTDSTSKSTPPKELKDTSSSFLHLSEQPTSSSDPSPTTQSNTSTLGKRSLPKKKGKRTITFGNS